MGRRLRHRPGGVGLRSEHPGITGAMGPSTSWDSWPTRSREGPWGRRSVHRSAKTASRSRFGAFVYTVAPTSCVGWHERLNRHGVSATPPRWPPLPWWENGLCASTAAARLTSSPRQQPTQTPEEPSFGHIRTPATSSDVTGSLSRPLRVPSQATSDRSSQHKREVHPGQRLGGPGLPAAPARVRPRRLNQGQQVGPGHHGVRLVEEAGPPRAPGPALPPGPCEARLPAQRPSIPTVPSWRRGGPPTAGMSHPPMFYARPGAG